jgi:hypothetical protein
MTAEIAIMNRMAIALAADSAVTIETKDGKKIFNTVNKLFRLSKYHPVGIMVYGNAEFMDTHGKQLLKSTGVKLKRDGFKHLKNMLKILLSSLMMAQKLYPMRLKKITFEELLAAFSCF